MVHVPIWLSLLILVQLVGSGIAEEPVAIRVERVETGLRPAIVLEESAADQWRLTDRMKFYKVPGVSIAVIDNGAIAWARGYGVREAGTENPVTTDTLFQAASISKPVAAVVALRLVEQGALHLDEDVNRKLRSWKLPENEFTKEKKVSLRLLLSHRAGLTDYAGFRDAAPNQPLPTLREILETGKWTPAPIRVGCEPGSRFAYSGGGYCLMEQLLEEVSGKPFSTLAHELVLKPLEMAGSSFDQDLSPERRLQAAVGHQMNGKKLPRNWNLYPATSAAGLWTTPSDLARFAIELQKVKAGGRNSILLPATMTEMLSIQGPEDDRDSKVIAVKEGIAEQPPPSWGLGVGLIGRPPTRIFHSGSNPGYQCELQAYLSGGQGAVIMTNGDQGWRLAREILWAIAREYKWPEYPYRPEIKKVVQLSQDELDRFVGQYRIPFSRPSQLTLSITRDGDRLSVQILDYAHEVHLYPQSSDTCFTIEVAMTLRFVKDETGSFTDIISDLGWRAKRLPD
jgi:CubicO group peptidase (beta-lactamase class C family)